MQSGEHLPTLIELRGRLANTWTVRPFVRGRDDAAVEDRWTLHERAATVELLTALSEPNIPESDGHSVKLTHGDKEALQTRASGSVGGRVVYVNAQARKWSWKSGEALCGTARALGVVAAFEGAGSDAGRG